MKRAGYRPLGDSYDWKQERRRHAYFVRRDLHNGRRVLSPEEGFVVSKLAQSRNEKGEPSFVRGAEHLHAIRSLTVTNTRSGADRHLM